MIRQIDVKDDNIRTIAQRGSYAPLEAKGQFATSVIAFCREFEGQSLTMIVPRLTSKVGFPPLGDAWEDTSVLLPNPATLKNLLTGAELASASEIRLSDVLREFPLAALQR